MSDMGRLIRIEQQQLAAKNAEEQAWKESPFGEYSPVVDRPAGDFAQFVDEVRPLISRKLWRKALVGMSPDGRERVTWDLGRRDIDGDGGPGSRIIRRRAQKASRCDIYFARDYESAGEGMFVLLKDGRASYSGDLSALRTAVAKAIASQHIPGEGELDLLRTNDWHFV